MFEWRHPLGQENSNKPNRKHRLLNDALALEEMPELGLRKCTCCNVTKSLGAFDVPAATSIKTTYKFCRQCCDSRNAKKLASGETKYTMNRARIRSLDCQTRNKASLLGSEGYEEYEEACKAANPEKNPGVPKPRLQLEEMEEKTLNHGMFDTILSCLFSNIFLEV